MDTTYIVKIENKKNLRRVLFKFPELMNKEAISLIESEYKTLCDTMDDLYSTREKVRELEKKYKELKDKWDAKQALFDLEFAMEEKEVSVTKSNLVINGDTVYNCNARR